MRSRSTRPAQTPWLVLAWMLMLALVPVLVLTADVSGIVDGEVLFRDVAAAADAPYYYGYFSTVSIMMWSAAAGVCLAGTLATPRAHPMWAFFVSSFLLSALLALDDGLLLHEDFFPARGLPEPVVYAAYAAAILAWALVNRGRFRQTAWWIVALSVAYLSASVGLDFFERIFERLPNHVIIEDGLKFVGIGLWLAYFLVVATATFRRAAERGDATDGSSRAGP